MDVVHLATLNFAFAYLDFIGSIRFPQLALEGLHELMLVKAGRIFALSALESNLIYLVSLFLLFRISQRPSTGPYRYDFAFS